MRTSYSRSKLVNHIVTHMDDKDLPRQVAAYLIDTGKSGDFDSVMRDARELRAQKYGHVELTARSAHRLEAPQMDQVETLAKQQYPGAQQVTVHQVDDPAVVGGINLSFPHANLDVTVRSKLNRLRASIS